MDTRAELSRMAGVIARYSVLHPCDSLRPERPSDMEMAGIIESCTPHPEAWAYFYACMADTISILEPPDPSCRQTDFETYSQDGMVLRDSQ